MFTNQHITGSVAPETPTGGVAIAPAPVVDSGARSSRSEVSNSDAVTYAARNFDSWGFLSATKIGALVGVSAALPPVGLALGLLSMPNDHDTDISFVFGARAARPAIRGSRGYRVAADPLSAKSAPCVNCTTENLVKLLKGDLSAIRTRAFRAPEMSNFQAALDDAIKYTDDVLDQAGVPATITPLNGSKIPGDGVYIVLIGRNGNPTLHFMALKIFKGTTRLWDNYIELKGSQAIKALDDYRSQGRRFFSVDPE